MEETSMSDETLPDCAVSLADLNIEDLDSWKDIVCCSCNTKLRGPRYHCAGDDLCCPCMMDGECHHGVYYERIDSAAFMIATLVTYSELQLKQKMFSFSLLEAKRYWDVLPVLLDRYPISAHRMLMILRIFHMLGGCDGITFRGDRQEACSPIGHVNEVESRLGVPFGEPFIISFIQMVRSTRLSSTETKGGASLLLEMWTWMRPDIPYAYHHLLAPAIRLLAGLLTDMADGETDKSKAYMHRRRACGMLSHAHSGLDRDGIRMLIALSLACAEHVLPLGMRTLAEWYLKDAADSMEVLKRKYNDANAGWYISHGVMMSIIVGARDYLEHVRMDFFSLCQLERTGKMCHEHWRFYRSFFDCIVHTTDHAHQLKQVVHLYDTTAPGHRPGEVVKWIVARAMLDRNLLLLEKFMPVLAQFDPDGLLTLTAEAFQEMLVPPHAQWRAALQKIKKMAVTVVPAELTVTPIFTYVSGGLDTYNRDMFHWEDEAFRFLLSYETTNLREDFMPAAIEVLIDVLLLVCCHGELVRLAHGLGKDHLFLKEMWQNLRNLSDENVGGTFDLSIINKTENNLTRLEDKLLYFALEQNDMRTMVPRYSTANLRAKMPDDLIYIRFIEFHDKSGTGRYAAVLLSRNHVAMHFYTKHTEEEIDDVISAFNSALLKEEVSNNNNNSAAAAAAKILKDRNKGEYGPVIASNPLFNETGLKLTEILFQPLEGRFRAWLPHAGDGAPVLIITPAKDIYKVSFATLPLSVGRDPDMPSNNPKDFIVHEYLFHRYEIGYTQNERALVPYLEYRNAPHNSCAAKFEKSTNPPVVVHVPDFGRDAAAQPRYPNFEKDEGQTIIRAFRTYHPACVLHEQIKDNLSLLAETTNLDASLKIFREIENSCAELTKLAGNNTGLAQLVSGLHASLAELANNQHREEQVNRVERLAQQLAERLKADSGNAQPKVISYEKGEVTLNNMFAIRSPPVLHFSSHGFHYAKAADAENNIACLMREKLANSNLVVPPLSQDFLGSVGFTQGICLANVNKFLQKNGIPCTSDVKKLLQNSPLESLLPSNVPMAILCDTNVNTIHLENTELLVGSFCYGGTGRPLRHTQQGLGQSFLRAGARSMVLSLWEAKVNAAATMLPYFYHYLFLGFSKSKALRAAQLKYYRLNSREPHCFGNFICLGDLSPLRWRPTDSVNDDSDGRSSNNSSVAIIPNFVDLYEKEGRSQPHFIHTW